METQLFNAIELDNCKKVRSLLFSSIRKVNINAKNSDKNTPLHVALFKKNIEIVKLLVEAGANVNLRNKNSETAFSIAFKIYETTVKQSLMKILLTAGAKDVKIKDQYGTTPLHVAAMRGDVELARLLISRGANVNTKNTYDSWAAVHLAANNVVSEDPTIYEVLLSAPNANVNIKTLSRETALHFLAKYSAKINICKIMNVFKKFGADFNACDDEGWTPLDHAVENSNSEAIKALVLCSGMNINSISRTMDETILHSSCYYGDSASVKFLIKRGADINLPNLFGSTPLKRAIDGACYTHDGTLKKTAKIKKVLNYLFKKDPNVNTINLSKCNILQTLRVEPNYFEMDDFLWKMILQHLSKLNMTGRHIHESLLDTISEKPKYQQYFYSCNQELEVAKNNKLFSDSWITYFNLLMDDKQKLLQYAASEELMQDITKTKLTEKFPIYGACIHERFTKAKQNRLTWNLAATTLSRLLSIKNVDSTHPIIRKILNYLNMKDLRDFVDKSSKF